MSLSPLDWKRLLEQHGFTEAQVRQWAGRKYPMFANNIVLMTYLFLREHGVEIRPRVVGVYQPKKVSELEIGDRAELQLLVAAKIGEVRYFGCPECYTKVEDRDGRFWCSKCSSYVEPVEYSFKRYIAGDETGTVIVVIPPYVSGELEAGKMYRVRGRMQDNTEFLIREYEEVPMPSAPASTPEAGEVIEAKVQAPKREKKAEAVPTEEVAVEEVAEEVVAPEEEEVVEEVAEEEAAPAVAEAAPTPAPTPEVPIPPEIDTLDLKPEEKVLAAKIVKFIADKGRITPRELFVEFGDAALSLLTPLRRANIIELVREDRNKYYFRLGKVSVPVTVVVGEQPPEEEEEEAEEERGEGRPEAAPRTKTAPAPAEVDISDLERKIGSLLDLFGGRISLEDFRKWYERTKYAKSISLDEALDRIKWLKVENGMVTRA